MANRDSERSPAAQKRFKGFVFICAMPLFGATAERLLAVQSYNARLHGFLRKKIWHPFVALLAGLLWLAPVEASEICHGIASKDISGTFSAEATCTVTDKISVDPGVTVAHGVSLSLYAPVVTVPTGSTLSVQGGLRVAASNPLQDQVWQTNLTLVEVSAIDTDSIQVSWLPVDDGVTPGDQVSYEIHVSQTEDFLPDASTLKHQQNGIQSAQIDGLTPGATYYVRMLASTATGFNSQSRQHRILMPAAAPVRTAQTVVELPPGSVHSTTHTSVVLVAGSTAPQVNDIITSRDPALLRRVTAIATNADGSITLTTTAASLGEVYQSVQINSSIALPGVPGTSPAAAQAFGVKNGPQLHAAPTGGVEVNWPQSDLRIRTDEPAHLVSIAPASLRKAMRAQVQVANSSGQAAVYAESDRVSVGGSDITITGPSAIAVVAGNGGVSNFSLVLHHSLDQELCWVSDFNIDTPAGKSSAGLASLGTLNATGTGRYNLPLVVGSTADQLSDTPYKVRFTAFVDDVGDNCSGDKAYRLWRERVTFEVEIFVIASPNFPVQEEKYLSYSGALSIQNTVQFSFAPALEAEVKLDGASLDYARLQATADAQFDQELHINASAAASIDQTKNLFQRQFIKVFMAGSMPVVMKGTLAMNIRIQGDVTGSMDVVEHLHLGFDELAFGFEYRNGQYLPIKNVTPDYSLKIHGDADAEANLKLSLLPALEVTFYEAATGKLVAEPYLTAGAGIHGQIHTDMTWDSTTVDADYWLTKGEIAGGLDLWLYADLKIWDYTLLQWPDTANSDQYETFSKVELIQETPILGLPSLSADQWGYGYSGNSRAMRFYGSSQNVPNPFKSLFNAGPDAFITFTQWVPPKVIAANNTGYQVLPPVSSSIAHNDWWIDFDRPGTYTVRMSGYSSLGGWARQVAPDITLTLTDNDGDNMIDQWESEYGITDPNADGDGDGLSNLQEFQQGNNPVVKDNGTPPPAPTYQWATGSWGACEGACGSGAGIQYRDVWCEMVDNGTVVQSSHCDAASEPADSQNCTVPPPQCPVTASSPLNDTGITTCSDENTNGLSCPVSGYPGQDGEHGRDVTHNDDSDGHAGFSFTKLDANGNPL